MEEKASYKVSAVRLMTGFYFAISIVEIMAEFLQYMTIIYIFKPLMPLTLMAIYAVASNVRTPLFFLAMVFSAITNLLFIPDTPMCLFLALIAFAIHRVFVISLIIKGIHIKDWVPVVIATVPFLLLFFYMLAGTETPENSLALLIFQNILISLIGGMALSNYIMADSRKNSWLMICGLLFVALQFIVFIEKYYLAYLSPIILRPVAMGLNAFAFYTFYEFVMETEKSDENGTPA